MGNSVTDSAIMADELNSYFVQCVKDSSTKIWQAYKENFKNNTK